MKIMSNARNFTDSSPPGKNSLPARTLESTRTHYLTDYYKHHIPQRALNGLSSTGTTEAAGKKRQAVFPLPDS
jgi:hypothetical protein